MKRRFDVHVVYELDETYDILTLQSDEERAESEADCLTDAIRCWEVPGDVKEIQVTAETIQE